MRAVDMRGDGAKPGRRPSARALAPDGLGSSGVLGRRDFCVLAAGAAVDGMRPAQASTPGDGQGRGDPVTGTAVGPGDRSEDGPPPASPPATVDLTIAGVGARLLGFLAGPDGLREVSRCEVPASVQYAWPHPTLPLLYVAFSNGSPTRAGDRHGITTLSLQANGTMRVAFGALSLHGRPIHVSAAPDARHLLVAYNAPSAVTVHALAADGRPGTAIVQRARIDAGIYAHQVRVTPDGRSVLLVTRGNDAKPGRPEDPGAIRQFALADDGQLRPMGIVAPNGGYGFGPRHLDFHPTHPWVYVSLERENALMMFELYDGRLAEVPSFAESTVRDSVHVRPRQLVAAIHLAADGRTVYLSNRADHTVGAEGGPPVFDGGENSVVAFRLDPETGRPERLQSIDTDSFNPRTFSLASDGRHLVAASTEPMAVRTLDGIRVVSARLTRFEVSGDGRLALKQTVDVDARGAAMFWSGTVAIPMEGHGGAQPSAAGP